MPKASSKGVDIELRTETTLRDEKVSVGYAAPERGCAIS